MHMADALLSPAVGGTFWAGTIAVVGLASRKLKGAVDERLVPLMGVLGAFIFASQMVNFTIPGTGSSGHLGGGLLLAVLLGPAAAFLVQASVLTVQALFFADGGLLALGCNIWNLGVYPCFIAYPLVYRPLAGDSSRTGKTLFAAVVSAVIGLQLGALSVVLQTLLSGKSELPFRSFVLFIQPVHLVIGAVEGIVTAGVINYVRSARPEMLDSVNRSRQMSGGISLKKVLITFAALTVIAGGALSWFSSTYPDGLDWSIRQLTGKSELPREEHIATGALQGIQERTAVMPDYAFKQEKGKGRTGADGTASWPNVEAATSVAGIGGAAVVFLLALAVGFGIKAARRGAGGARGL